MHSPSQPISPLDRLTQVGFQPVGWWRLGSKCLQCCLECQGGAVNVLYAFMDGDELLYVGKTVQPLRMRMRDYERPGPGQSTNIRSNEKIRKLLESGRQVRVLALPDNGLLRYGGFHVNLAAGLEDSIVRELRPTWNITGRIAAALV